MDRLWAPWRMQYIQNVDAKDEGCIFCNKPRESEDQKNLILYRGSSCFVIMNLFPYNNGHLMIVPYQHTSDILNLEPSVSEELWSLVCLSKRALSECFKPEGFNIGMNLGRVSGAGIDQHLHMHIVPRWNGDSNFMPVIGETKVISQAVGDTYRALHPYFNTTGSISSAGPSGR